MVLTNNFMAYAAFILLALIPVGYLVYKHHKAKYGRVRWSIVIINGLICILAVLIIYLIKIWKN